MALAVLCARMQQRRQGICRPSFHAFIVDHKARANSTEEAQTVALRLNKLGKSQNSLKRISLIYTDRTKFDDPELELVIRCPSIGIG